MARNPGPKAGARRHLSETMRPRPPTAGALGKFRDTRRRSGVVGEHDRGPLRPSSCEQAGIARAVVIRVMIMPPASGTCARSCRSNDRPP